MEIAVCTRTSQPTRSRASASASAFIAVGKHADMVCAGAVHVAAAAASPEVAAADHNGNLGSQVIDLFDAGADGLQRAVIQAGFLVACKRFSAELDKHTLIHKFSLPIFFLPGPFDPRFYYLLFYRKVGHDVKPLFFFFPVCSNPAALFCEKRGEAKGQKKRVQASPCTLPQKAAPALILPCWQLRLQSRRPFSPGLRPSRNVRRRRSQSCRPALWLWLRCKI